LVKTGHGVVTDAARAGKGVGVRRGYSFRLPFEGTNSSHRGRSGTHKTVKEEGKNLRKKGERGGEKDYKSAQKGGVIRFEVGNPRIKSGGEGMLHEGEEGSLCRVWKKTSSAKGLRDHRLPSRQIWEKRTAFTKGPQDLNRDLKEKSNRGFKGEGICFRAFVVWSERKGDGACCAERRLDGHSLNMNADVNWLETDADTMWGFFGRGGGGGIKSRKFGDERGWLTMGKAPCR